MPRSLARCHLRRDDIAMYRSLSFACIATLAIRAASLAQVAPVNGVRPNRLIIRNAMVVDGNGTPARGPFDIVLDGNTISQMTALDPVAMGRAGAGRRPRAE